MFATRKESHAMRHHNTVFHTVLKLVPWQALDRLVKDTKANKKVRRLTTQNQFVALLYAQLAGIESLRAIAASLASHASKLYHLGACEVSRSTLSDANALRPCAAFTGLLAELMARCERAMGRRLADAVYLIDSTGVRLSSLSADWAQFCAGVSGAKLHIVYNPDSARPSFAEVTPANVNDITVAKAMPIKEGATYVFDLGYYDYGWWAKLNDAGCRIVTRLKINTPLAVVAETPMPAGSTILSDRIGHLPARQARSRQNPAHRYQRSRCSRRRDHCTLQATLANRAILPVGQAHSQNSPLLWNLRKRHSHSDRGRAHRLPAAAHGAWPAEQHPEPAHLRATGQPKPNAPPLNPASSRSTAAGRRRFAPVEPQSMQNLNRTAVGSSQPSTSLSLLYRLRRGCPARGRA